MRPKRGLSRRELAFATTPLVAGLAGMGCRGRDAERPTRGELAYDIDHLRAVDPQLIRYHELSAIEVAADAARAITVGAAGHLYVAADHAILRLDPAGAWARIELGDSPVAVAETAAKQLVVAFEHRLELWDLEGRRLSFSPSFDERSLITSIAITDEGIAVADAGLKRIHILDFDGRETGTIGGRDSAMGVPGLVIPSPYCDLAIAPDGFLWVVNPGRHAVENYAPDGRLRSSWGRAGMDIEGFCGCCNPTHLAVLPNGSFVTAEKGLPRVKVYDVTGRLQAVVAPPAAFAEQAVGLDLAVDHTGRILVLDPSARRVRRFAELG